MFVHSFLNDLGLSSAEFRVYAHYRRRASKDGTAFPGTRSVAAACRIDEATVTAALRSLVTRRLLRLLPTKGARGVNIYSLTHPKEWQQRAAESHTESPEDKEVASESAVRSASESAAHQRGTLPDERISISPSSYNHKKDIHTHSLNENAETEMEEGIQIPKGLEGNTRRNLLLYNRLAAQHGKPALLKPLPPYESEFYGKISEQEIRDHFAGSTTAGTREKKPVWTEK